MCDPTTMAIGGGVLSAANFGIQALGANAAYGQASQQANRTNAYSYLDAIQNNVALAQTYNQFSTEQTNANNAASTELFNDRLKATEAEATARAAGGAAGVDGSHSLDALMQSYIMSEGRQESAITQNLGTERANIYAQEESAFNGTQARNNALPSVQPPSRTNELLKIAGAGVGDIGQGLSFYNSATHNTNTLSTTQVVS